MSAGILPSSAKAAQIVKLSPALKQLLKSRNPDPLESPSALSLTKVFTSTLVDAKERTKASVQRSPEKAVTQNDYEGILRTCLTIMTATLLTKNIPSTMGALYRFATTINPELGTLASAEPVSLGLRTQRTAVMREAGLKCTVLVGIPRTINTLGALREATNEDVKVALDTQLNGKPYFSWPEQASEEELQQRGGQLFDLIYTPHTSKLLEKLGTSHPDFPGFIVQHAYGGSLSNRPLPSSTPPLISRTLVSALAIACLRAQGRVGPQLTSHVLGLLKAANEGGPQTLHERWLSSEEGVEWVIESVDRVCDVVSPPSTNMAKL
ncbi:hypothetical protein FRB95_007450 [Tulasnella sp. JGI-2019a]|nr:hypothetical protein FRB93_001428 [Tulasnella sp. JGI-2019a]KAG9027718.1 hypothetical protein FRB95_007450 [Tulasnella sp. JGI-2019a]